MKHTFESRLKKDLIKFTVIFSGGLLFVFLMITFFSFQSIDDDKVEEVLATTQSEFNEVIQHYALMLSNADLYTPIILGESESTALEFELYKSKNKMNVESHLVLFDLEGHIKYSSITVSETNLYMKAYNNLLINRMRGSNEIQKVNYNQFPSPHYYMIGKAIMEDDLEVGYAIFYIDSNSLANKIFNSQYDGVVTDEYHNIIATSNQRLTDKFSFVPTDKMTYEAQDTTYDVTLSKLTYEKLNFYVVVATFDNSSFYIQIILLFIVSIITLIFFTFLISNKFARNNSRSIGLLVSEMEKVKYSDKYRIEVKTNDEFEELATDINQMVKQLRVSRKRNEQLLKQKNINEIKSLEAQFHPHFLYNTLDTIRYALFLNPKVAEQLLLLMTKILRYSVSNEIDEVKLVEDYKFVNMYVEIHQHRHQGKISYSYQIDKDCENVVVPKLFIQPLIENSIKYGFKSKDTLNIDVTIRKHDKNVIIDIIDSGSGIPQDKLELITQNLDKNQNEIIHTGLYNSKRRIALMYPNSVFNVSSNEHDGTVIHIEFEVN